MFEPQFHPRFEVDAPACYVAVRDTREFLGEFDSFGAAEAFIDETTDMDERLGLQPLDYVIVPVKVSPGGRDFR